jgi:hypothetical protein
MTVGNNGLTARDVSRRSRHVDISSIRDRDTGTIVRDAATTTPHSSVNGTCGGSECGVLDQNCQEVDPATLDV